MIYWATGLSLRRLAASTIGPNHIGVPSVEWNHTDTMLMMPVLRPSFIHLTNSLPLLVIFTSVILAKRVFSCAQCMQQYPLWTCSCQRRHCIAFYALLSLSISESSIFPRGKLAWCHLHKNHLQVLLSSCCSFITGLINSKAQWMLNPALMLTSTWSPLALPSFPPLSCILASMPPIIFPTGIMWGRRQLLPSRVSVPASPPPSLSLFWTDLPSLVYWFVLLGQESHIWEDIK